MLLGLFNFNLDVAVYVDDLHFRYAVVLQGLGLVAGQQVLAQLRVGVAAAVLFQDLLAR